ncbi:MAG: DUF5606 domain-containing protein [Chitinophagales bacterium]|nr:DUF5606 domain-containing protein [Chitinophagales bacterium]MDW8427008.1 DUF5606 domain-containing protein [Chitinophagales bacterium]
MTDFSKIVAITGLPGLFELIASRNNGAIVRNLQDGKSQFIPERNHALLALSNIALFLNGDNSIPLPDVLHRMHQQEEQYPVPDPKAEPAQLQQYLAQILPDYDRQRVHLSDMRRLMRWYHILREKQMIPTPTEPPASENTPPAESAP